MPRELLKVDVKKISLVGRGANGDPLRVFKSATGVAIAPNKVRISDVSFNVTKSAAPKKVTGSREKPRFRREQEDSTVKPEVSFIAVAKSVDLTAIAGPLEAAGFVLDHVVDEEDSDKVLFLQKEGVDPEADGTQLFSLASGVILGVTNLDDMPVPTVQKADEMTFAMALGAYGVHPMMNVARDVLGSALCNVCYQHDLTAATKKKTISLIIDQYKEYVISLLDYLPEKALKADKEFAEMAPIDLYKADLNYEAPTPVEETTTPPVEDNAVTSAAPTEDGGETVEKGGKMPPMADDEEMGPDGKPMKKKVMKADEPAADAGDPNKALLDAIVAQTKELIAPLAQGLETVTKNVETVTKSVADNTAQVTTTATTVKKAVIGGAPAGDLKVKKQEQSSDDDSFAFDTGLGRKV